MGIKILEEIIHRKIIDVNKSESDFKLFTEEGHFLFYHQQDCCEDVYLEDITGDIEDLIGNVIYKAEVVTNYDDPIPSHESAYTKESYTWTYFKIGSNKGEITLRFFGCSNGYYSEDVDIVFISNNGDRRMVHLGYDI